MRRLCRGKREQGNVEGNHVGENRRCAVAMVLPYICAAYCVAHSLGCH